MKTPDLPPNEEERLRVLHSCNILDTPPEPSFDTLTSLARQLLRVPISLLTLVDSQRVWLKSKQGLMVDETPRDISFCAHAVASGQLLLLEDARADPRFADHPNVVAGLGVRFYAGLPLVTHDGYALGTLCVVDTMPRKLSREELDLLSALAVQATAHLEKRRENAQLARRIQDVQQAQQAFFQLTSDLLCIADHRWVPLQLSAAWEPTVGRSVDELRRRSLTHWLHPEDVATAEGGLARLQSNSATASFRARFRHQQGHYLTLMWTATMQASVLHIVAHDLTEVEQERAARARGEERLRAIFAAAPAALITLSIDSVIEQTSPALGLLSGYATDDLVGHSLAKLLSPEAWAEHVEQRDRCLAQPARSPPKWTQEVLLRRRDGKTVPAAIESSVVVSATGRSLVAKIRDQTVEKATAQALSDSETRLRKVIDTAAEAIIIASSTGTMEQVNSSTVRLFGYAAEELIGQNLRRLMPAKEAEAHDEYLANYARTGQPRIIGVGREVTAQRKDGSKFVAGLTVSEFLVGGQRCYAGILRDLSEQKRVEAELVAARDAAEEASHAKSQFLANMSHEIRTPLNAVIGYATLLLDTPLVAAQQEHVQAICTAANSLLGQLNAVLDLSKIEANKLELELGPTDLILAMEDAVEIVAEQARSKGLRLTCILESDCPTHIVSDSGRLRQVLLNLAHNALKFTERGEVVIRAARRQTATGWELLFTVRDTGAGIPSDSQSKLFQPFTQADPSIARRHGGSGLGLSICRRLVEALGGNMGLDSTVGLGSTFWFTLPLQPARPEGPETLLMPGPLHGRSALLVEPHGATREQLAGILVRLGLRPLPCINAAMALRTLAMTRSALPGVVFIGGPLPDASAEQLAADLRQLAPADRLPLIRVLPPGPVPPTSPEQSAWFAAQLATPLRAHRVQRALNAVGQPGAVSGPTGPHAKRPNLQAARSDLPAPRILVAEDNPTNQHLAMLVLQRLGCRVDLVGDGQEAVATASLFSFDAILMDMQMPEMSGTEATQAIRKLPPPASTVPIIALTASAFASDRAKLLGQGLDDYLSKPLNFDDLQRVLRRWLPRHFADGPTRSSSDGIPMLDRSVHSLDLQQDIESVQARLHELSELLDESSADEVLALARVDWPKALHAAEASMRAQDLAALGREAHYLAGSALQVGASGLGRLCREIEQAVRRNDATQARQLLATVAQRVFDLLTSL